MVPAGYLSIAICIALNMLGRPCTPRVSAGGVANRTNLASGAIAYAHSISRVASSDHPAAKHGPESPLSLLQTKLVVGFPNGYHWVKSGAGKLGWKVSWKKLMSLVAGVLPNE